MDAYKSGFAESRKAIVTRLLGDSREHPLWVAKIAAMLGETETAFSVLDGVYFGRGPWAARSDARPPTHPLFSAATASLRHNGRFNQLLEETGLEAFWRKTNTQPDFRGFAAS